MELDLNRYVPEIIMTAVGGLMVLVRTGDVKRIDTIEQRLDHLENAVPEGEQRIYDKLEAHAKESRESNAELQRQVIAILERKL